MKIFSSLILVLFFFGASHAQTIRIADNNVVRPTGANVYSTLQAAIDAAQPDDIVYITPSNTSYGDVTIAKRIILQGVGFNTGLGDRTSTIGTLSLTSSTDGINSVSGSVLRGFNATAIRFTNDGIGSPTFNNIIIEKVMVVTIATIGTPQGGSNFLGASRSINNLIVRSCALTSLTFFPNSGMSDCKIYNNTIIGGILSIHANSTVLNNSITNNIFQSNSPMINIYNFGSVNNTVVSNNIFSGSGNVFYALDAVLCTNNIFYGSLPNYGGNYTVQYFRNNTFSYNLLTSASTMPPAGVDGGTNNGLGNITGVSPNFVSVASTTWSSTYDYTLSTGSPAKNAGSDGTDIGPTGGAYPINKNIVFGPSALPIITEFNTSGVVLQNQPIKANLKAKSN